MKNKNIKNFEKEMQKALELGYFINMTILSKKVGVELFLPQNIDEYRARAIANVIKNKYNLETIFYIKTSSIKVFYDTN